MLCTQVTYAASQAGLYAQPTPRASVKAELLRLLPPRSPVEGDGSGGRSDQGFGGAPQHRMGSLPVGFPRTQLPPWASPQQGFGSQGTSPRQHEQATAAPGIAEGTVSVQQV